MVDGLPLSSNVPPASELMVNVRVVSSDSSSVAGLLAELIVSRTADAYRPYSIAQRIGESPAPDSPSPAVSDHAQD